MLNSIKGFFSKSVKCWRGLCEVASVFGVGLKGMRDSPILLTHSFSSQILLLFHEQRVMQ